MKVRFIGPEQRMGPVPLATNATFIRGEFVRVVNGEAVNVAAGSNTNLAVALDGQDPEYETRTAWGNKPAVDLAFVGEAFEIEVPFRAGEDGIVAADIGGAPKRLLATSEVDLASTTNGVFHVRRLGRETTLGDSEGYVIGVIEDAAAF